MLDQLTEQLVRDEGEILHAYQDSRGYWTIGVGVLIDPRAGGGITRAESRYLLANRLQSAINDVDAHFPWARGLDDPRHAVLVVMCFNLGITRLSEFHITLGLVETGQYTEAALAMLDSVWSKQVGDRANRLAEQMRTGVWQ